MYLPAISRCLRQCSNGKLDHLGQRVRGLVFDSCPVDFTRTAGLAAVQHMRISALPKLIVSAAGMVVEWWSGSHIRQETSEATKAAPLQKPALFLYCRQGDDVAPASMVERWAEQHIARGNRVYRHCWEKSEHVGHIRCHPQDYHQALQVCSALSPMLPVVASSNLIWWPSEFDDGCRPPTCRRFYAYIFQCKVVVLRQQSTTLHMIRDNSTAVGS